MGSDPVGSDPVGSDLMGSDLMGSDLMGSDLLGSDLGFKGSGSLKNDAASTIAGNRFRPEVSRAPAPLGGTLRRVEGAGHHIQLDQPGAVVDALLSILTIGPRSTQGTSRRS